jgi:hypothetical protein
MCAVTNSAIDGTNGEKERVEHGLGNVERLRQRQILHGDDTHRRYKMNPCEKAYTCARQCVEARKTGAVGGGGVWSYLEDVSETDEELIGVVAPRIKVERAQLRNHLAK